MLTKRRIVGRPSRALHRFSCSAASPLVGLARRLENETGRTLLIATRHTGIGFEAHGRNRQGGIGIDMEISSSVLWAPVRGRFSGKADAAEINGSADVGPLQNLLACCATQAP